MRQKKKFEQHRRQFNLFEDNKGVWQCKGQLSNLDEPYAVKNQIQLPRNHPLTSLLVQAAHERVFHDWIRETLTEIRRKYWIPQLRSLTRQLLFRRKLEGTFADHHHLHHFLCLSWRKTQPLLIPALILLVQFTFKGVSQKAWICLFSCYVMRAVHLEATPDDSRAIVCPTMQSNGVSNYADDELITGFVILWK